MTEIELRFPRRIAQQQLPMVAHEACPVPIERTTEK
jgi:hypothetical protein